MRRESRALAAKGRAFNYRVASPLPPAPCPLPPFPCPPLPPRTVPRLECKVCKARMGVASWCNG